MKSPSGIANGRDAADIRFARAKAVRRLGALFMGCNPPKA